jgi:BON domain
MLPSGAYAAWRAAQTGMTKRTLARYFWLFGSAARTKSFKRRDTIASIIGRIRNVQVDARQIEVEAHGSKTILSGTVRSWAERDEAQVAAWVASGISEVDNCLKVTDVAP